MININSIDWEIISPPHEVGADWLSNLRAIRGKVYYENGLRPFFKISDGIYSDNDEFDFFSYHILAKQKSRVIGAIRLMILDETLDCVSARIVGSKRFADIIREIFPTQRIIEVGRLVVEEDFRHTRLHLWLMALAWLVTLKIDAQAIANSGNTIAKYHMKYAGASLFPKYSGPYKTQNYNEDVFLLFFNQLNISPKLLSYMNDLKKINFSIGEEKRLLNSACVV